MKKLTLSERLNIAEELLGMADGKFGATRGCLDVDHFYAIPDAHLAGVTDTVQSEMLRLGLEPWDARSVEGLREESWTAHHDALVLIQNILEHGMLLALQKVYAS